MIVRGRSWQSTTLSSFSSEPSRTSGEPKNFTRALDLRPSVGALVRRLERADVPAIASVPILSSSRSRRTQSGAAAAATTLCSSSVQRYHRQRWPGRPPPFLQHSRLPVDRRPNDARKDEPSALQGPFVSRSANFGRLDPRRGLWVTDITPRPPPTEAHPECRTLRTKSAKFRPRARCRVVVVLARSLLATTAETSWHQVQS